MCGAVQLGYSKVVLPMLWDCSQGYLLFVNDWDNILYYLCHLLALGSHCLTNRLLSGFAFFDLKCSFNCVFYNKHCSAPIGSLQPPALWIPWGAFKVETDRAFIYKHVLIFPIFPYIFISTRGPCLISWCKVLNSEIRMEKPKKIRCPGPIRKCVIGFLLIRLFPS